MPTLVRDLLASKIADALHIAIGQGAISLNHTPDIIVEHPSKIEHGDFSTNLPLRLSRATRLPPMEIADILVQFLLPDDELGAIWAEPPGFINFSLRTAWLQQCVTSITQAGQTYGTTSLSNPQRIIIEFVSVNPTGPVHVGHTRGAVLGSALSSILEASGHLVYREYYVNDAGTQMDLFYTSVHARYLELLGVSSEFPEEGYKGDYVNELAKEILATQGDRFAQLDQDLAISKVGTLAREAMIELIKDDLLQLGVDFHLWFAEASLFESGEYDQVLDQLRKTGYLTHRDGALWFMSSMLGDEKDNVIIRSTGKSTYFASDIAYHHNKFIKRGFDKAINVWGADHQGHINRLKAAIKALGVDPGKLEILISQMVTIKRGNQVVKASKRSGQFITLKQIVDEVGPDACRYFFLSRSAASQMDFDTELATRQSSENPVFYIQYAHARISSILRNAREQSVDWSDADVSLLTHDTELNLIRKMLLLPEIVQKAADTLEPHHVAHYALELATSVHWFYDNCRVLSNDTTELTLSKARLRLVESARVVLNKTLVLMGMSCPETM